MKDYDLEIKQYEDMIKELQEEKKVAQEKEEIEKRRQEEINKLKDEMVENGKKLVNLRNEFVVACSDFRKAFSKIDGFDKWEGLLIDNFGVNKDNDKFYKSEINGRKNDKYCRKADVINGLIPLLYYQGTPITLKEFIKELD